MTGPPPVLANGGIYRHLKVDLLAQHPVPGIMTQILHFTDYNVDSAGLQRWLKVPISEQIQQVTGNKPFLFVDSGGYRLLYNTGLDTERFGIEPSVKGILALQTRFGGDLVATLDYPLPRGIIDVEAKERIKRSIRNCLETARLVRQMENPEIVIQMAVHGRDRVEARETVIDLLKALKREDLVEVPFGLAIGSLVPLSSSPLQVLDIVRGVHDGIRSCEFVDPAKIPVHAFGVSSRMIPFLAAMGVDTFDGSTYVQQAQQLRYVLSPGFSIEPFLDIEQLNCGCRYCMTLEDGGLEEAKRILRGGSFRKVEFAGKVTNKSFIYALIALHNLQASLELTAKVSKAVDSADALEELFLSSARDAKMRRIVAYFARLFPEASEFLWRVGVARTMSASSQVAQIRAQEVSEHARPELQEDAIAHSPHLAKPRVSLLLGPEAFDVTQKEYELPKAPVMLLLPCSQQKPYSSSPSHRFIDRVLREGGISREMYTKVSISGNYGPVPELFETEPEIQSYDFYLSSGDDKRIELLAERSRRFLEREGPRFAQVIGYCTSKAYREVMERATQSLPNATVLPADLRVRRQSEFRKEDNVRQLVIAIKRYATKARK